MDAHWSAAFIKAVFGYTIELADLESVDPELYTKRIRYLQNCKPDEIADLGLTFEDASNDEQYTAGGGLGTVELKPGGSGIAVTKDNLEEYLRLFVHHRLFHAIKPQVDAVVEGLAVFVSDELRASLRECCTVGDIQLLISGVAEIDVDDWEASARYTDYTAESQEVRWFWRLVRAMDAEQVRRGLALLLSFLSALCHLFRLFLTSLPSNLVSVSLFGTVYLSFSRGLLLCLSLSLAVALCLSGNM